MTGFAIQNNMITTDTILKEISEALRSPIPMSPDWFLEKSMLLNDFLGDENLKLVELKSAVAKLKLSFLDADTKRNVSDAKVKIEASEEFKQMGIQDTKCRQIVETIRLAKLRAKLSMEEIQGYGR